MTTRSVLVHLPQYPLSLDDLMPDQYLASMAAALRQRGHKAEVRDYGTLETLDWVSCNTGGRTERATDRFAGSRNGDPLSCASALFRQCQETIRNAAKHRRLSDEIASELGAVRHLDFIAFRLSSHDALRAARRIGAKLKRQRPRLRIIGIETRPGLPFSTMRRNHRVFDCIIAGRTEHLLPELADRIQDPDTWTETNHAGARASSHYARASNGSYLNLVSPLLPDYSEETYPALTNATKLKLFVVEDSLPGFCFGSACRGDDSRDARNKAASAVCNEIRSLQQRFGATALHIKSVSEDPDHASAVARALFRAGIDVFYSRSGPICDTAPQAFTLWKASGCEAALFQVDTGSALLLERVYGRGIALGAAENVLRASRKTDIYTVAGLTYPCGEDDWHTRAETLRLLDRSRPQAVVAHPPFAHVGNAAAPKGNCGFTVLHTHVPTGQTRADASREQNDFLMEVASRGMGIQIRPETALMARMCGRAGSEAEFAAVLDRALAAGDAAGLSALVQEFNAEACSMPAWKRFSPATGDRAAVGN